MLPPSPSLSTETFTENSSGTKQGIPTSVIFYGLPLEILPTLNSKPLPFFISTSKF